MNQNQSKIEIKRANDRFVTRTPWLDSRHSFSFGGHYDPSNIHHGLLLVSNDDIIKPDTGFETHPHQDMEIVTWVLRGELEHRDSEGNKGIIYPGLAQRMSAGRGIWHSEINASKTDEVRLIQMWVLPDTARIKPGYEQLDISAQLNKGGLVPVASGRGDAAAISIRQKDAVLYAGQLKPNEAVSLPEANHVHLYIAVGDGTLEGAGLLKEGEAARLNAAGAPRFTAGAKGAEVLAWATGSGPRF